LVPLRYHQRPLQLDTPAQKTLTVSSRFFIWWIKTLTVTGSRFLGTGMKCEESSGRFRYADSFWGLAIEKLFGSNDWSSPGCQDQVDVWYNLPTIAKALLWRLRTGQACNAIFETLCR